MRKISLSILLAFGLNFGFTQSISLEIEQFREDTSLVVDIFIKKISGDDFELGSASFPLADVSSSLLLEGAIKLSEFDGIYSNTINSTSYSDFYLSAKDDYVHLILLRNFNSDSQGQLVTNARERVARIKVPIVDRCGTAGLFWLTNAGTAITTFQDVDITNDVNYIGPSAYRLTPELVVPVINQEDDMLYVLEKADKYVWSRDGLTLEEDSSGIIIDTDGDYVVSLENECERKESQVYKVESITAVDEMTGLSLQLTAFPNPYHDKTIIQYSLNNTTEVNVEVYDLIGNRLATLNNGTQVKGVYNYPFSAAEKGYKSGVYLVKITAGDIVLTQKIIELGI